MTVTAVADESNVRVKISAALAACLARFGCGQDGFFFELELLAEDTARLAAVRDCICPVLCVDVHGLHVVFADIFEALLRSANSSISRGKFAVEDVLGYMATPLPVYMAKPSQPALSAILVGVVNLELLGFSQMRVVRRSRVVVITDWQKQSKK